MSLNKSVGNMYGYIGPTVPPVVATWNPICGCEHDCSYCYIKNGRLHSDMKPRLRDSYLKDYLLECGQGTIFVGSAADMFGNWVPRGWIQRVLLHCLAFPENTYLLQSKSPYRFGSIFAGNFNWFRDFLKIILATTIETDMDGKVYREITHCQSPQAPVDRAESLRSIQCMPNLKKMVTVEPIIKNNPVNLAGLVGYTEASIVVIGANSFWRVCPLPEPSPEDVKELVCQLGRIKHIKSIIIKPNLKRLLDDETYADILALPRSYSASTIDRNAPSLK